MRPVLAVSLALLAFVGFTAPVATASQAIGTGTADVTSTGSGPPLVDSPDAGVATDTGAGVGSASSGPIGSVDAQTPPPDPPTDRLGWEAVGDYGIWYNETIDVDGSDGFNETEIDKLVARTMARVEVIRGLEFEGTTPVEIRSREAYAEQVRSDYANLTDRERLHQDVKYEAAFLVAEGDDAVDQLAGNLAANVLGFYSPSDDAIVLVSDEAGTVQVDELTLAHELVHALQDQNFDLGRYDARTTDQDNGIGGIVEGDAQYVEILYRDRCNGSIEGWNGTCVRPPESTDDGGDVDFNVGIYLVQFQPYSDGPVFVHDVRRNGSWEAVDDVYANPPASSEQTIHPEKYPEDAPTDLNFEDRSNDDWEVLDLGDDSIDYATFGEAGLFVSVWYPSYRDRGNAIIPYNDLFQGVGFGYDTYNYDHQITDGWDGDELYPYVPTDGTLDRNRTGYVWKLAWDTEEDAREFVDGYQWLLDYYGADRLEDRVNTYVVPEDEPFGDAYYVERSGTTVWIVNAPSVEELPAIREGAAPEMEDATTTTQTATTRTQTTTTEARPTTTATTGSTTADTATTTTSGGSGETTAPLWGFGVAMALVAILVGLSMALSRRRD